MIKIFKKNNQIINTFFIFIYLLNEFINIKLGEKINIFIIITLIKFISLL